MGMPKHKPSAHQKGCAKYKSENRYEKIRLVKPRGTRSGWNISQNAAPPKKLPSRTKNEVN